MMHGQKNIKRSMAVSLPPRTADKTACWIFVWYDESCRCSFLLTKLSNYVGCIATESYTYTLFSYCSGYCAVGSSVSVRGDSAQLQHSCALTNCRTETQIQHIAVTSDDWQRITQS